MAHGDAREGQWRGNWPMEWVASTLHTTSEHGVSSITTVHAHTSAASSRLNWRPRRFKWTRPFRRKTKSGFRACAITVQTKSTQRYGGLESVGRKISRGYVIVLSRNAVSTSLALLKYSRDSQPGVRVPPRGTNQDIKGYAKKMNNGGKKPHTSRV